jgi:hypothetical protein
LAASLFALTPVPLRLIIRVPQSFRCDLGADRDGADRVPDEEDVPREPAHELVATDELARLHRIEEAAREVLNQMQGRRSASPLLSAIAALRAALAEKPT